VVTGEQNRLVRRVRREPAKDGFALAADLPRLPARVVEMIPDRDDARARGEQAVLAEQAMRVEIGEEALARSLRVADGAAPSERSAARGERDARIDRHREQRLGTLESSRDARVHHRLMPSRRSGVDQVDPKAHDGVVGLDRSLDPSRVLLVHGDETHDVLAVLGEPRKSDGAGLGRCHHLSQRFPEDFVTQQRHMLGLGRHEDLKNVQHRAIVVDRTIARKRSVAARRTVRSPDAPHFLTGRTRPCARVRPASPMMPLIIPLVLLVACVPLVLALVRANEIAFLRVRHGQVKVVRGGLPKALLHDLEDILRDVDEATLRLVAEDRRARVYAQGELSNDVKQRIRNVVGMHSAEALRRRG